MENDIKLLSINEIIKEHFYISSYQRGYRWEKQQVTDLLDDIWEFSQQEKKKDEFYCLQPVVVKKKENKWELIDGQQRLTTIYIILYYLERKRFDIEFATREKSREFLHNIDTKDSSNIDFYFIGRAYEVIKAWFERKEKDEQENTVKDEFNIYLGKYTKIIWYEVNDGASSVDIFTRLNIGKIPLTNAELIKALFLKKIKIENQDNLKVAHLKELEIANEWDRIEYALQDEEFWGFINRNISDLPTRIEFIFNSIAEKNQPGDEYFTFRKFSERLEKEDVESIWGEVKDYFMILNDWFNERTLFHLIGFLITCGEKIEQIRKASKDKTKTQFREYITNKVKQLVNYSVPISRLEYGTNSDAISRILLLFNIETILRMKDPVKFSFALYKKEEWSIEHIHPQNPEGLNTVKQWASWIEAHIQSLERIDSKKYKNLIREMNALLNSSRDDLTSEKFQSIFYKVQKCFENQGTDDLHLINNLALLDKNSNSGLNNSFFDVKRAILIGRDKEGYFIPPCTRNVFLKYYSSNASQLHFWGPEDRQNYYEEIVKTLSQYLPQKLEGVKNANN